MEDYNGEERRQNMDLQTTLLQLVSKVEAMDKNIDIKLVSMEENLNIKIESVKDKVGNLEEKLKDKISTLENRVSNHVEDEKLIIETINDHDKKIIETEKSISEIIYLQNKYSKLEDRVDIAESEIIKLKNLPAKTKAKYIDDFIAAFRGVLFVAISTGLIGFIIFLFMLYFKSLKG